MGNCVALFDVNHSTEFISKERAKKWMKNTTAKVDLALHKKNTKV